MVNGTMYYAIDIAWISQYDALIYCEENTVDLKKKWWNDGLSDNENYRYTVLWLVMILDIRCSAIAEYQY